MTKRSDKRKGKPVLTITGTTQSGKNIINNQYIEVVAAGKKPGTYRDLSQSKDLYRHRQRLAAKKTIEAVITGVQPEDVENATDIII